MPKPFKQISKKTRKSTFNPFMPKDGDLEADYHSLFNAKQNIEINHYSLYLQEFDEDGQGLVKIFNELKGSNDMDSLEIFIDSPGGSVHEGIQFYNIIDNFFRERTTTFLDPAGYSMGALLFCMGDKRYTFEHSSIMFHDYRGGTYGKSLEQEDHMMHTKKYIHNFFKTIIVDKGFLSQEEFDLMLVGKEYWFDTEEMCRRNICTHVIKNGEEWTSEEYIEEFFPEKKAKKKTVVKKIVEAFTGEE